ncbi:hypothetical protein O3M35_002059 [Rhynocoris fuscipes]|uniref:LRRNT domain-containing protein n=1 Tax=Rhynocoris fuscipes TaxID=488301 RepID=A0AAW1CSZ7_9HEMI
MILIILLLGELFLENGVNCSSCYEGCFCHYDTMNCSSQSLEHIPDVPESVTNLILAYNLLYRVTRTEIFEYLTAIDLSNNRLKSLSIELANSSKLHTLKLSDNPINSVQIVSNTLKILDISWCDITHLQANFLDSLPSLELLDISYNPLKLISGFNGNIQELHLKGCLLHDISLFNLPQLKYLDISFNRYMKALKFDSNLTVLKAAYASLYQADFNLPKLKLLDLSHNKLSQVIMNSPSLIELNLSWNSLRNFEINLLESSLEKLDISHNLLNQIELFANDLQYLNASFNPLNLLKIHSVSLELIDCASCQLKIIDLPKVRTLNLSRNNLEIFDGEATVLDLSHNLLDSYKGISKFVDLRWNRLSLPKNVSISGSALLDNNPWFCQCQDVALKELYMRAIDQVKCASPEGKTWESCFRTKLPKYMSEYPWVPLVISAVLTVFLVIGIFMMKKKLWPTVPNNSSAEQSQSDYYVVPQTEPSSCRERPEDQLPSYEEALFMNKPRNYAANRRSYELGSNRRLSSSSI